ncbi:MAG: hypothetical protein HeimC3_22150 [Candidatus Heimdallarchaeota archaeon LC_3]|nr:MAG: hypothetical protein HeimC3_22150 [Candidatus Heimdallarchaeota archaeon LC_3]
MLKKRLKAWYKSREQDLMWNRTADSIYSPIIEPINSRLTK